MLEESTVRADCGKRRGEMKEEGGRWKEGGRQNKRKNGRCRTRKKMCRSSRLALFHTWGKKNKKTLAFHSSFPLLPHLIQGISKRKAQLGWCVWACLFGGHSQICGVQIKGSLDLPPDLTPVLLFTYLYTNPYRYYCLAYQGSLFFFFCRYTLILWPDLFKSPSWIVGC